MIQRRQRLRIHEIIRQRRVAFKIAPQLNGVINHLFLCARSVFLQNFTGIGIGEYWLDPRGHIARIEADRPRRRNRRQKCISYAILTNCIPHIWIHVLHCATGQKLIRVKEWERAFLTGQIHRRQIGRAGNLVHPFVCLRGSLFRPVAQTDHQQSICQTGNTQTDTPLCLRLCPLRVQREPRGVNNIVHHADRSRDKFAQSRFIQAGTRIERIINQPRHVDGPKQTRPIGRQRLLATGVCGRNRFAVVQVVHLVDAVNKNDPGFGIVIG